MNILAYDTSGDTLSVAAARDGKLVCELENMTLARHAAALVPLIEKTLRKARWKPSDVDVLAVGVGPGSFTGIRVGLATAKMLAVVWKRRLVGVSSLEATAYAADSPSVAVDARRGRVYAALYEKKDGRWMERLAPSLTTLDEFKKKADSPVAVLERPAVRARSVAQAGLAHALAGKFLTPDSLEPLYLHPKDCHVTSKPR